MAIRAADAVTASPRQSWPNAFEHSNRWVVERPAKGFASKSIVAEDIADHPAPVLLVGGNAMRANLAIIRGLQSFRRCCWLA